MTIIDQTSATIEITGQELLDIYRYSGDEILQDHNAYRMTAREWSLDAETWGYNREKTILDFSNLEEIDADEIMKMTNNTDKDQKFQQSIEEELNKSMTTERNKELCTECYTNCGSRYYGDCRF